MFENIGGKIKALAKVIFVLEASGTFIIGIVIMANDEHLTAVGLPMMFLGPILAWISSWVLYGFGELIDKVSDIARNTYSGERKSKTQSKSDYKRIEKIEKLRSQGLITEEEYLTVISKPKQEV